MKATIVVILATALTGLASAQAIDPNSVGKDLRCKATHCLIVIYRLIFTTAKWCFDQKTQCPLLCTQVPGASGTKENRCDSVCPTSHARDDFS